MPHGYTNATSTDGRRVVKRYLGPDSAARQSAETLALTHLAGRLPVPVLLDLTSGRIDVGWIAGVPGQERLETHPEQVLYVVGDTARRLQGVDVDTVPRDSPAVRAARCWCTVISARRTCCWAATPVS